MPELPEVETVKNELLPHIIGRRITGVSLCWEGIVRTPSPEEFKSRISGQEINALRRRGKYLIFSLSGGEYMIAHLKMTGSLLAIHNPEEPGKFVRAIIHLDDGCQIHFRDPRKFGVLWLVADPEPIVGKLGPEPLEDDFTVKVFAARLAGRKAPIKPVILDQNFVAGIGNMYADESLYEAQINPLRPASSLSLAEIKRLHHAIRRILRAAIESKGASVENYYRPGGELGTAHFQFRVAHGLGGDTCHHCGKPIKRIVLRGRGTYYCPHCQLDKPARK